MTATEEALAAMAKAEENWDKMVNRTVEVSGQFVEDCKEFRKEQREWFLENVPNQPKQDPRFLP
jgi:vacuolar-type H+-ATPase subunit H